MENKQSLENKCKQFCNQSISVRFLRILSVFQDMFGNHSKRKLLLSLISSYLAIFVRPRKSWSVAQTMCVPSMGKGGNQKAPGSTITVGGVTLPN